MNDETETTVSALRIEPATAEHLRALIGGPGRFRDTFALTVVEGYTEFDGALGSSLRRIVDDDIDPQWSTYLFIHIADEALIGLGGFKGPPADGTVEIGYSIAPAYRGVGHASEAARALIERARAAGIATVVAHTVAEPNPSTRLLERHGFVQTRTVEHPDLGKVWRWEKPLTPAD